MGRTLRHFVAIAEDVGMQLSELDGSSAYPFHPTPVSDILRDKCSPDGNRLEWTTTSCGFEADAARVLVPEDTESMAIRCVRDLTTSVSSRLL